MSAQPVRQEASRLFVLGLVGNPEVVAEAREAVLGAKTSLSDRAAAEPFLCCASPPYSESDQGRMRYADLLVSLPGGPGLTDYRPADTLEVASIEDLKHQILMHRPDLRVTLARRLPGFRDKAAEMVIRDVSRVNAEFVALSTVAQSIPFLAPLLPVVAGADILLLTKNQAILVFRLAAIYGEDLALTSRVKEVATVVGGAFGWRTIARQLAGALPGAMGLPLRAGIAFSGTYAVGRAAQMVFDQGRRPTRQEMLRIYEEGRDLAQEVITALRDRFRKDNGKQLEAPLKALPPGEEIITVEGREEVAEPRPAEPEAAEPRMNASERE
jgi:uncharacterized protein (DUF697 family)